jgi:hypothetical protein
MENEIIDLTPPNLTLSVIVAIKDFLEILISFCKFVVPKMRYRGCFPKFAKMLHSMLREDLNKKSEIRQTKFLKK